MKTAIIIILYNNAELIVKQIECIRRFCIDVDYDIILIDNSNNQQAIDAIKYRISDKNVIYHKTDASTRDFSGSHAFACNVAYWKYKDMYDYILFLDHDNFPVKPFSVSEVLGDKIIAGLGQSKPSNKIYLWPGCLLINNSKIDHSLVNFETNTQFGLDTGGNLYKIIEHYGIEACLFFDEVHTQNYYMPSGPYSFFAMINNGMYMHFINGSNWNTTENYVERMNSLLNILQDKLEI